MAERYSRQIKYLGGETQNRLSRTNVCIVGCGALGTVVASMLVRAGIGSIRLIDYDLVDLSNIHRTELFDEEDVDRLKVDVVKEKLERINSEIKVDAFPDILRSDNLDLLVGDVVIDCTDNIETRYLINDYCIDKVPWIYGAVIKAEGMSAVFNGRPCLRCLMPDGAKNKKCKDVGILSSTVHMTAAWQVMQVINLITKKAEFGKLFHFNLETGEFGFSKISHDPECKTCST